VSADLADPARESVTKNAAQPSPKQSKQKRTARMIRQLRNLGYRIDPPNPQP
jgi:hypothetical protein